MSQGDSFAGRLTGLMAARRMSVTQFHEELGGVVSERTIFRWRAGKAEPGIGALPFICRALNTTPNELAGWGNE